MNAIEIINQKIQKLPETSQTEVLDFVEFLLNKTQSGTARKNDLDWYNLSLTAAMRGMENEETVSYDELDLKEKWK